MAHSFHIAGIRVYVWNPKACSSIFLEISHALMGSWDHLNQFCWSGLAHRKLLLKTLSLFVFISIIWLNINWWILLISIVPSISGLDHTSVCMVLGGLGLHGGVGVLRDRSAVSSSGDLLPGFRANNWSLLWKRRWKLKIIKVIIQLLNMENLI